MRWGWGLSIRLTWVLGDGDGELGPGLSELAVHLQVVCQIDPGVPAVWLQDERLGVVASGHGGPVLGA